MLTFLVVLILAVAVLLVFVVLAQNSKGGGLTDASGASSVIGAQRSTDWIEKATWGLSISLFVLCLLVNVVIDDGAAEAGISSPNIDRAKNSPAANIAPALPASGETSDDLLEDTPIEDAPNEDDGSNEE